MEIENVINNPWDNVYWFCRMLINSDKYGGIGSNSKVMLAISEAIKYVLELQINDEEHKLQLLKEHLRLSCLYKKKKNTDKYFAVNRLCDDLDKILETTHDYKVLALTCEKIIIPINKALNNIPSDDEKFAKSIIREIIDEEGEKGLANIINMWDEVGSKGCIAAERTEIIEAFGKLRIDTDSMDLTDIEKNMILTAFCQEYERRVGQKRKGRAGRGVEGITSFILDYFNIKATHAPDHFTTGLEIDKWIKTKDNWVIGISCKRTLRERWKQAYTTDLDLLNRHKIRELWHVITYDKDLSDDKLTEIGSHRAVLYLPDESQKLKNALNHPGMQSYVRPMSRFVEDLRKLM